MSDDNSEFLNARQTAAMLGRSRRSLERWRQTGGGPEFVRLGERLVAYRRQDIEIWIERHKFRSLADERAADAA